MTRRINNKLKPSQPSKLSRFLNTLHPKRVDMLGSELKFKYRDQDTFQTGIGGLLTLIVIIVTLGAFYSTIQNFIIDPKPEVSISTKYSSKAPKFDLYKEEIALGLSIHDTGAGTQVPANIPKYFTIKAYIEALTANPNSTAVQVERLVEIGYKPCSEVKDKNSLRSFMNHKQSLDIAMRFGICPELDGLEEKFFIQSKFQDPPHYELYVYIFPCSLQNRAECASIQELASSQIYYTNIRKGFDPDNFTNPVSTLPEFDGILNLDPRSTKTLYFKVKYNEIWDDNLDFFDATLRTKYADYFLHEKDTSMLNASQIYCSPEMIRGRIGPCRPYAIYSWQSSGETQVIKRTYSKFFGSLGEVGGTSEMLTLFALLLYTGYNNFFVKRYLENELFCKQNGGHEKIDEIFRYSMSPDTQQIGVKKDHIVRKQTTGPILSLESERSGGKRKNKNEKEEKKTLIKVINKNIEKNKDGVNLYQRLNRLEVLETIIFEDHDRVLMPVVLLNMLKTKENERDNEEPPSETYLGLGHNHRPLAQPEVDSGPQMTIEDAYESLERSNPTSDIKQLIKSFILKNLPSGVKRLAERKQRKFLGSGQGPGQHNPVFRFKDSNFTEEEPQTIMTNLGDADGLNLGEGTRRKSSAEAHLKGFVPYGGKPKDGFGMNLLEFHKKSSKRSREGRRERVMFKANPPRPRRSLGGRSQRMVPLKKNRVGAMSSERKVLRFDDLNQINEEG